MNESEKKDLIEMTKIFLSLSKQNQILLLNSANTLKAREDLEKETKQTT